MCTYPQRQRTLPVAWTGDTGNASHRRAAVQNVGLTKLSRILTGLLPSVKRHNYSALQKLVKLHIYFTVGVNGEVIDHL